VTLSVYITCMTCHFYRWLEHQTGRYTRPDPLAWDITDRARYLGELPDLLYSYSNSQPTTHLDPLGLEVMVCQRPNQIPQFQKIPLLQKVSHKWIKTPHNEAGLGEAGGRVPGDQLPGECGCVATEIVDHSGEADKPGSTCRLVRSSPSVQASFAFRFNRIAVKAV
jgi:hypothetical protein